VNAVDRQTCHYCKIPISHWHITDTLLVVLDWCVDTAVNGSPVTHTMCTRPNRWSSAADAVTVRHKYMWYECDDDSVTVLTQDKFLLKLKNSQNFTPYLLFYTKCYR